MFSFESISKISLPQLKLSCITAFAIGSGAGAAIGYGLLPWYYLLLVAALFFMLKSSPRRFLAAGAILCAISGICHKAADDANAAKIPSAGNICGELRCTDRRTSALPELMPPNILNCRIKSNGTAFNAAVIFPDEQKRVLYGEKFRFSGKIYPAVPAGLRFDGNKLTETLPALYGNRPLLRIDRAEKISGGYSFFTPFFLLRDKLLFRLLAHVDDQNVRTMAAKMFFSASAGVPRRLNNDFIISGTIHIFSVSGLHVTLLAGIILMILKFAPFKWSHLITAMTIPLYVLCTGASLPSVRAGTMVFVWCIMRSMFYYSPGWNAMMLTWSAFALLDPETVASLGAQYSFGITGALLLLLERLKELRREEQHITDMMPQSAQLTARRRKSVKLTHRIISTLTLPVVAFTAGSGISMRRQHLFVPGSIAANCLLPLFTPLLFGTLIFKLCCFILPDAFDRFGAWLLTKTFNAMVSMISALAEIFGPVATAEPPVWGVMLFYILFFTALRSQKVRTILICNMICAMMLWMMIFCKMDSPGKIIVINRSSGSPALLAYIPPGGECAEIVDNPDYSCGALAGRELRKNGVLRVRAGFSRGIRNNSAGMRALAKQLPCTAYIPSGKRKNTAAFMRNLQDENICCDKLNIFHASETAKGHIKWHTADGIEINSVTADNGRHISIKFRDGDTREVTLPWCSRPVIWSMEIPPDKQ